MGLVHYVHFILLFLVCVAKCHHEYECSDWLPQFDKPDEPDCYMPKEGINNLLTLAPSSPYPVSWVINNSDLGEIDVEFAIMSNYTDYIINLAVSNVSEHTCAGPHLFKKHSTRNYIIAHLNDSENDNFFCERTGHLIFQYVYTGCYRIEIEASSPNKFEGSYKSFTRFIKTNYVKTGLTKSPIFNHNFYNSMMLRLIFSFDHDVGGHQLSIKLSDEINFDLKDVCQDSGSEVMCCSYMPEEETKCRTRSSKYATECILNADLYTLTCDVQNVTAGNYCITVDVEDDRCDINSVWITPPNYCRRTLVLNLNESLPSYDLTELFSEDSHNIILSVMLSILVLALVLVAICYFKTMMYPHQVSRQRRDDSLRKPSFIPLVGGDKDSDDVMSPAERILLLYAYDCEPFMELMATFRKLLNSSGFEVLDCFDEHNYNDISVHPTQWILDLLSNSKVKLVIASSKCARKQQRFRNRVCYRKDRCFSPLFLYGLDYINKNNSADMFERCFHVRFDGFTDEEDMLAHVTTSRIYTLPIHINDLISHLGKLPREKDENIQFHDNKSKLCGHLADLIKYKKNNDFYMNHFLDLS